MKYFLFPSILFHSFHNHITIYTILPFKYHTCSETISTSKSVTRLFFLAILPSNVSVRDATIHIVRARLSPGPFFVREPIGLIGRMGRFEHRLLFLLLGCADVHHHEENQDYEEDEREERTKLGRQASLARVCVDKSTERL